MTKTVLVGDAPLTIAEVAEVARQGAPVVLADGARARMVEAQAVVARFEAADRPVYGLTRGLGRRVVSAIEQRDRADFSPTLLRARATGAGPALPREVVRAALFARIAGLAQAGAGVRPVIVDTLIAMLAAGVHPLVPSIGSVGASDLPLTANLALPVIGEGRAEFAGEILPGAAAMRRAGIAPVALQLNEGLALCSANAVSTAMGALVLVDTIELAELLDAVAVLTFEAFRANPSPLDARVVAARPAPGQAAAAASLRAKLAGSTLFEPAGPRRVQDPISLRCVSQVHGALRAAIDFARPTIEVELNGAGDNPLVLADAGEILSTGNFHTPAAAIAFDALALALSQTATMAAARVARLMNAGLTDLPDVLSPRGRMRTGLGLLSLTATALCKEIRRLAQPASLDDASGFDVEDHVPMTPAAMRKAGQVIDHLRQIVACELITAAQALELRAPAQVAPIATALHAALRREVTALDDDRSLTEDVEAATRLITTGSLADTIRATMAAD